MPDSSDNGCDYNKGDKIDDDEVVKLDNEDSSNDDGNDDDNKADNANQAHVVYFDDKPSQEGNKT
jgi:hypothetical protein